MLFFPVSTSVSYDMLCRYHTNISQKQSMKLLTISALFCLVSRREWTYILVPSSKKWAENSFSMLDHAMIGLGVTA